MVEWISPPVVALPDGSTRFGDAAPGSRVSYSTIHDEVSMETCVLECSRLRREYVDRDREKY